MASPEHVNISIFIVPGPRRLGATAGQGDLESALGQIGQNTTVATIAIFDFAAVEVVNASYLRATILWLLHASTLFVDLEEGRVRAAPVGLAPLNVLPMIMNIRGEVMDDVTTLLSSEALPLLMVDGPERRGGRCLGRLDAAQRDTLGALTKVRSATATMLCEQFPQHPPIKPPAWSNRLADLHRLRLAGRVRQWRYVSPVEEEVRFG